MEFEIKETLTAEMIKECGLELIKKAKNLKFLQLFGYLILLPVGTIWALYGIKRFLFVPSITFWVILLLSLYFIVFWLCIGGIRLLHRYKLEKNIKKAPLPIHQTLVFSDDSLIMITDDVTLKKTWNAIETYLETTQCIFILPEGIIIDKNLLTTEQAFFIEHKLRH